LLERKKERFLVRPGGLGRTVFGLGMTVSGEIGSGLGGLGF